MRDGDIYVVGPLERLGRYRGRTFNGHPSDPASITFGDALPEAPGTLGRRGLHAHGFTSDHLSAIRAAFLEGGDLGTIAILDEFPSDWRYPDGSFLGDWAADQEAADPAEIECVSSRVLELLKTRPDDLHRLSPREFEELVAELISRLGYDIHLMPGTRDGGVDIIASRSDSLAQQRLLVQCKRYRPDRRVGVEKVRELYGVVQQERATGGVIATTSYFTKGAVEEQRRIKYAMTLKDVEAIREWLSLANRPIRE